MPVRSAAVLVAIAAMACGLSARANEAPAAAGTSSVAPPEAGVIGAGTTLWVYEFRHDADARRGLRFVFRSVNTPAGSLFAPLPLAARTEPPAVMAARGEYLHLFLSTGGHQRLAARRAIPVEPVPAVRFVELDLPNRSLPKLVAGDTPGDAIYAVVSPAQAVEIVDDARRRHEIAERRRMRSQPAATSSSAIPPPSVGAVIDNPDSPITPPEAPATGVVEAGPDDFGASIVARGGDWFIARYASAQWTLDRAGPPGVGSDARFLVMAALGGQVHLLTESASPGAIHHHVSSSPNDAWRGPEALPTPTPTTIEAIGWVKETLTVVLRGGDSAALRLMTLVDGAWKTGPTLIDGATPAQAVGDPVAVGVFDEGLALARRESRGLLQIGVWSVETGRQTEPYQTLFALTPPATPLIPVWGMELIQIIVFLVIFGLMIAWRREAVATTAVLPPDRMLCPPLLRMLAFLLDAIILSPVWAVTYYAILVGDGSELTLGERMQLGVGLTTSMGTLMPSLFGLIFAVYATACELTMSATLGKRIVGAQIASVDGQPCARWRIIVRNLVRVVEFALPGVLLLVMLTRNRQRFGDLAAGTIVIARALPSDPAGVEANDDRTPPPS